MIDSKDLDSTDMSNHYLIERQLPRLKEGGRLSNRELSIATILEAVWEELKILKAEVAELKDNGEVSERLGDQ